MYRWIASLAVALVISCATTYHIRPEGGGKIGTAVTQRITLLADPQAWKGDPYDLPNYLTPILIHIKNYSNHDLRVSYADFSLINEQGFRYSAINPYTGEAAPPNPNPAPSVSYYDLGFRPDGSAGLDLGIRERDGSYAPTPVRPSSTASPLNLASYSSESRSSNRKLAPSAPAMKLAQAPKYHQSGQKHVIVTPGRRFFVHPRSRIYFSYYQPWPYFFPEPPFYTTYVYAWNDTYYPPRPSQDVLQMGLPEGVVKAEGEISGFLYFQNASQRSNRLQLRWDAFTTNNKKIATLTIYFVVLRK